MRSLRLNAAGEVDRLVFSIFASWRNTVHNHSMQIGNRLRCYPTPTQAQTLLAWIGCQRFIYNAKVGEDRYFRRFARQSLSHTGAFAPIDQQYSHFKTEQTPWLGDVPSQILCNGAVLWKQA